MTQGILRVSKTPRKGRFSLAQALAAAGAVFLVLSWLTTEHYLPWVSWHAEATTFLGVFLLCWIAGVACWRSAPAGRVRVPWATLPFALLGVVAVLQIVSGTMTFGGDAIVVWFYAALCIACLILGFNIEPLPAAAPSVAKGQPWPPVAWLALAFVAGSIASVVVAFAQVFDLWEYSARIVRMPDMRRPGGNLGQPNQLATLLVMGIASAGFLHLSGRLNALASALIVLFLSAGLAASESRSGVVGLLALLLWLQFKRREVASQLPRWAGAAIAMGALAMFVAWPHLLNAMQLPAGTTENRLTNGDIRLGMWTQLLEAVWQRPWAGWGIAEVAKAHNSVAHAYPVNNPFSYSHNLLIDLAVWMGLPIALALACAAAIWLWRRAGATTELTPWYCLAVALPLATHSMLEFPFAYAYFLAPVMFLLGVLERSVGTRPLLRIGAKTGLGALLVLSGALLWSVAEYFAIEEDFRIVRFEQLRVGRTAPDHHPPDVMLLTQLGALLNGSRVELRPDMPPEDLEQLRKLALRYPWLATQYRYALALALNGDRREALRQFQVIRWQRDEVLYQRIRKEIGELAQSRYPQLGTLNLP
jgi:hypothetical protein